MRHLDIAPCDCRTSQGAMRQLRTLRNLHVAPCEVTASHLATSACRTLRLKNPALGPLNHAQPPQLIPRQIQHPRHTGVGVTTTHNASPQAHPSPQLPPLTFQPPPFAPFALSCRNTLFPYQNHNHPKGLSPRIPYGMANSPARTPDAGSFGLRALFWLAAPLRSGASIT